MFDTHCHLNSKVFETTYTNVIREAQEAGISHIMIPGTDVETSRRAVEIAPEFENTYAAVGIHPHHVFEHQTLHKAHQNTVKLEDDLAHIEGLLKNEKVRAVGEVGIDRYYYRKTKYNDYEVNEEFVGLQRQVLTTQIQFAIKHKKSLILHNREAVDDFLEVVGDSWDKSLEGRTVFHCCEPDDRLLTFAKEHRIFWGVDGDVTYSPKKAEFIKKVPLEMLVLETDSPFLVPEPMKSKGIRPNTPALGIPLVVEYVARLYGIEHKDLKKQTMENAIKLFNVQLP